MSILVFSCMERWYKWPLHANTCIFEHFSEQMSALLCLSVQFQFIFEPCRWVIQVKQGQSRYPTVCPCSLCLSLSLHFGVRTFVHKVPSGNFGQAVTQEISFGLGECGVGEKSRMAIPCLQEMWNVSERCKEKKRGGNMQLRQYLSHRM